jgi:uridylate kinase
MKTAILSLGGSLIFSSSFPDTDFINDFARFAEKISQKTRLIVVVGGGRTARSYITAGKKLGIKDPSQLDWLGIEATRLNAGLVKRCFSSYAYKKTLSNPFKKAKAKESILIYSGYKPGFSSDYVAAACAKTYSTGIVLNLTNVDFLYDKNPSTHQDANPIKKASWQEYLSMFPLFSPGMNCPFDPVAAEFCRKNSIKVAIINGRDFRSIKAFLAGKKYKGTLLEKQVTTL